MAKRRLEPMHDEAVNVTPLIDVVMCLIIFFLVVGKLVKDETSGGVEVPRARHGQELDDQVGRLTINIIPATIEEKGPDGKSIFKRVPGGAPTVKVHGQ